MTVAGDRCAVVVVDVQNDFCHDDGATARMGHDASPAQAIVPEIEAPDAAARLHEIPVVFVRTTHTHCFDMPGWVSQEAALAEFVEHIGALLSRSDIERAWGGGLQPEEAL